MSKKKKKKTNAEKPFLYQIDKTLNGTYEDIMNEISEMQYQINLAEAKARKKARIKSKRNPKFYNTENIRKEAREQVVASMESTNFLDRITFVLNDIAPVIVILARLVASLILSILSFTSVKLNIKPETLQKLNAIYTKAMSIK